MLWNTSSNLSLNKGLYIRNVTILDKIRSLRTSARKGVALLIDPDHVAHQDPHSYLSKLTEAKADFIFVGGSLITTGNFEAQVQAIRASTDLPLVLFPGSPSQLNSHVDAVLLLSLVSGRNAELLIGHHVTAAPRIRELQLEAISTGYMLIDGGRPTTASYISNTAPIPSDKPGIAVATALAVEQLGMHCIYLDAGSGAAQPVPPEMIRAVRKNTQLPIIVGGGIRSREMREAAYEAGADLVVIGNALEQQPERALELTI